MIGLVLVTHAGLASELKRAAEMIVGKMENVETIGIEPDDSVDKIRDAIAAAIGKVSGTGVIVMTDMFGGTPSNMSLSFLDESKVEVLTGVNLPMMIKFATERTKSGLADLAKLLRDRGREGILVAGEYLKK